MKKSNTAIATFFYSNGQRRRIRETGGTHTNYINGKEYTECNTLQGKEHKSNWDDAETVFVAKNLPLNKDGFADTNSLNITTNEPIRTNTNLLISKV